MSNSKIIKLGTIAEEGLTMRTKLRVLVCCTLLLALTSCVESEQPLSDAITSQQDPDLYGLWTSTNSDGDINYVIVGAEQNDPLDSTRGEPEPGLMRYWSATVTAKDHKLEKPEGTRFICTKIGDDRFISWVTPQDKDHPKPLSYFFLKYRVEGKKLTVWSQDPELTAQAIEAGKLKGVVKRKKEKNSDGIAEIDVLRITDSTKNIVAFMAAGGAKSCFLDKIQWVYTRPN